MMPRQESPSPTEEQAQSVRVLCWACHLQPAAAEPAPDVDSANRGKTSGGNQQSSLETNRLAEKDACCRWGAAVGPSYCKVQLFALCGSGRRPDDRWTEPNWSATEESTESRPLSPDRRLVCLSGLADLEFSKHQVCQQKKAKENAAH